MIPLGREARCAKFGTARSGAANLDRAMPAGSTVATLTRLPLAPSRINVDPIGRVIDRKSPVTGRLTAFIDEG